MSFVHDLHSVLDKGSQIDCLFLDFSKAFDKVSHQLLLHKLGALKIDPAVLTWIHSFLCGRSQYVTINNVDSDPSPVLSGVPQGSVLGPLLFLIYINDLPQCVTFSSIRLFADDCVIYREISNNLDSALLQSELNNVLRWCKNWKMVLNLSKCKHMRVSRKIQPSQSYTLNNSTLERVSCYKYLGIFISSDLSWKTHVEYITNNANRTLGYVRRKFHLAPHHLNS